VRYVLEGSVRRFGTSARVNAQLVDAQNNSDLWAEQFYGDTIDLFALQSEITARISVALNTALIRAEVSRPTENPDALDFILRGRAAGINPATRGTFSEQVNFFERALALDPQSVEAKNLLAIALAARVLNRMTDTIAADIARAEELVEQVLPVSSRNPLAHYAKALTLRVHGRYEEALPEFEMAIEYDPNASRALAQLGLCKLLTGSIEDTIPLLERAIQLSPRDSQIGIWYDWIGRVHLLLSRTDEAIRWFERARIANPEQPFPHSYLASALMRFAVKPNAQSLNSRSPASCLVTIGMRVSPGCGPPASGQTQAFGVRLRSGPCSRTLILLACVRPEYRKNEGLASWVATRPERGAYR
jgi:tetratricopeptide (TPR) repeat protein